MQTLEEKRAREKRWRDKNREHLHAYNKLEKQVKKKLEYRNKHRKEFNERSRIAYRKIKEMVLNHYGPNCKCCGESEYKFLSIDHIENGKGNPADRSGPNGSKICYSLVKQNLPPGYQVLCYNCNCAKVFFGSCPHQDK